MLEIEIGNINQLDPDRHYTYADYLTWRFTDRVELIMGKIFKMSPAPSSEHQRIVSVIHGSIFAVLKKDRCQIFPAPFDVVLISDSGEEDTVVQPDISIICDPRKITKRGCLGAPDLVVEVVSPFSIQKDLHEKYSIYECAGIKEYWLVHPHERSLIIFSLSESGTYGSSKPLTRGDIAISKSVPGLQLTLDDIFENLVEEPEESYSNVRRI